MMRLYTMNQKILLTIAGVFLGLLLLIVGGILGLQYFYEDFVAAKTSIKESLGIVTEADLQLISAQEAQEAAELAELEEAEAAEAAAEAEAALEQEWLEIIAAEAAAYVRTITINGQDVDIDLAAETHTWFDAYEMRTDVPNTFVFGDFSGYDVIFEGQAVEEGSTVEISLDALSISTGLSLTVTSQETGVTCYYFIRTLHSDYDCIAYGEGEGDGYYYFTNVNAIYKMDTAGNIVYYKVEPDTKQITDFKQSVVDGEVYYSYIVYTEQGDSSAASTKYKGVVMDANYQVIDTVDYMYTQEGVAENASLDMHEFLVLGEEHYMFASYVYQVVDNVPTDICEDGIAYVQATVMQEVKDGEILLQWNSTDYPEFYEYSIRTERLAVSGEDLYVDYMHFNSIAIDPADDNLILSFRSLSALIKIDRETGDIIWILGGDGDMFGLTDEEKMSYQHFPQVLDNGTITVFDNGTEYEQTRALEYLLDEENLTLIEFSAYQIDGWYSASRGSAICLSQDESIYLMGWGEAAANNVVFSEINFSTGETLFQLIDFDCEGSFDVCSYRVYKFDS